MNKILVAKKGQNSTEVFLCKREDIEVKNRVKERKRGIFTLSDRPVVVPTATGDSKQFPFRGVLTPWGDTYTYDEREVYKQFPRGTYTEDALKEFSNNRVVPLTKGRGECMVAWR